MQLKEVEEVWPRLKMKNIGGHTSSTILNSCSFQRYRLLTLIQYKVLPGKNLLLFAKSSKPVREVESRHFWLFFRPKVLFIMSGMTYVRPILILHNLSQMSKSNKYWYKWKLTFSIVGNPDETVISCLFKDILSISDFRLCHKFG